NRPFSRKLLQGDNGVVAMGEKEKNREAIFFLLPTQSQFCHFDQDTSRSGVSPGEIYSVLSLPHYAQKLWVNSQNDKLFQVFVKVRGWVTAKPSPTP
ncbi:MAG: hypothetical protein M0P50_10805, partial [Bacteroidales bacterium]|nr:hypothetical protein [Bacteroidales bacterium]